MSKKYSTDELVKWMEFELGPHSEAIIARLRAGNNIENKSLMKVAKDLDVSFSAAKICYDKGWHDAIETLPSLLTELKKWVRFMHDNYTPEEISWWDSTEAAISKAEGKE